MENKLYTKKSLVLCVFLGHLGIHRFYARKTRSAILMLVTLGGLGCWHIIDCVVIIKKLATRAIKKHAGATTAKATPTH